MEGWFEAIGQVAKSFAAWVLDIIEGTWKKATVPKDE
jgi:hypothetical protein